MFRLRADSTTKDDEDEFLSSMEQNPFFCLPTTDFREDIPPDKVPNDGFEYIQLVKRERENCERNTTSNLNVSKKVKKTNKRYYVPSNEDRKHMLNVFFNARYSVKSQILKRDYTLKNEETLPPRTDMLSWCAFCLGANAMFEMEKHASTRHKQLKQNFDFDPDGYEPSCRFVCSMSKTDHIRVLSYTDIWLRHLGFYRRLGLWIHSLLLVLERPLIQESENVLSYLAGTCISARQTLDNDDDILNLYRILCAISSYFECKPKKKKADSKIDMLIEKKHETVGASTNQIKKDLSLEISSSSETDEAMQY